MAEPVSEASPPTADFEVSEFDRRLRRTYERLPPAAQRVVRHIDLNRLAILSASAAQIAEAVGTSDATVIRAVQALGFAGLADLRRVLTATIGRDFDPATAMRHASADAGQAVESALSAVVETHLETMQDLLAPAMQEALARGVRALDACARVFVFGIGPSGFLSEYVTLLLVRHGRDARALNATGNGLADQLVGLRAGDGLLVLAYGRTYAEVVLIFSEAQRLRLPVVLVTDSLEAPLARRADVVIPARRGRQERVALHGVTLIVLEALVMGLAIADAKGAGESLSRLGMLRSALRTSHGTA